MKKRALILGIGGMDGSYLADILLEKGYEVHGMVRRSSVDNLQRLRHIPRESLTLYSGDMADPISVNRIIRKCGPCEIYNEADQDRVDDSFATVGYSMDITAGAVGRLLEIVRCYDKSIKVFQPCSATMFGNAAPPQNEKTPFDPQSPYAVAKVAAYYLARFYRKAYGMFVTTAILYNHDSQRRGEGYLLQKICRAAVNIFRTGEGVISLGDLNAKVDIGYAKDYMRAAWNIMQLPEPDDYVISTGNTFSVGALAEMALSERNWDSHVIIPDPDYVVRPGGHGTLVGDYSKAWKAFGYKPETTTQQLIHFIIDDLMTRKD